MTFYQLLLGDICILGCYPTLNRALNAAEKYYHEAAVPANQLKIKEIDHQTGKTCKTAMLRTMLGGRLELDDN